MPVALENIAVALALLAAVLHLARAAAARIRQGDAPRACPGCARPALPAPGRSPGRTRMRRRAAPRDAEA